MLFARSCIIHAAAESCCRGFITRITLKAAKRHSVLLFSRLARLPRASNKGAWRHLQKKKHNNFYVLTRVGGKSTFAASLVFRAVRRPHEAGRSGVVPTSLAYAGLAGRGVSLGGLLSTVVMGGRNARMVQYPLGWGGLQTPTQYLYAAWYTSISRVLYFFLFIKLKYKGKSYKWFRRGAAIVLRFGYSHIALARIPLYLFSRKVGKMKMLFFGTSTYSLHSFISSVIQWRPMNIYNGRGLRFARQLVFRKFGKVSAYR